MKAASIITTIITAFFLNLLLSLSVLAAELDALASEKLLLTNSDLPYLQKTITVDGVMDEAHWSEALKIPLEIETNPAENHPAPVKTVAYLYEDGETLYVGFKAFDPRPDEIRAYFRDRDKIFSDDSVGIIIDPANLRNLGYEFFVNAVGSQLDLTEDDLNKRESTSWDGIWDSAAQINAQGYVVEMAIPLRLMRLAEGEGKQKWAFELLRFYPRDFVHRLSNNRRDRNIRCHLCQLGTLQGFEHVKNGNDIQLVPSLVLKKSRTRDVDDEPPVWDESDATDPSLDLRWGINSNWTLNATLNPDFSQIEADSAQLSINTRFALFFPEKRSFFLEGADIFSSQEQLIHTRLVAEPDWGIKLTGEQGSNNWALFSVNDTETTVLIPGNQGSSLATIEEESVNTAARFTHSFNNGLNLGALITHRDSDSYSSTMTSIDGRWDVTETQQISAQFMDSDSQYPELFAIDEELGKTDFNDSAYRLTYVYSGKNWFGNVRYLDFGKDFRADLGFVNRVDFDKKIVGLGHSWFGEKDDFWEQFTLVGDWDETYSQDGELLERELEGGFRVSGLWQSFVFVNAVTRKTLFDGIYFDENSVAMFAKAVPVAGIRLEIFTRFGDQIDFDNTRLGDGFFISPEISWNIGKHWLLQVDHVYQTLDVSGGELFNVTLDDIRITWQKNNRTSVRLTTQYQRINRNTSLYLEPDEFEKDEEFISFELLYSYKVNPQTLVFVGLNSGSRTPINTRELKRESELFFVKFSYSWLG